MPVIIHECTDVALCQTWACVWFNWKRTDCKTPIEGGQELALEDVQFAYFDAPDLGIVTISTKCVAEGFCRNGHGSDNEAVDRQRRDREPGNIPANLVDVMKGY